jgi:beta-exotoxin I transport system permease protein
MSDLTRLLGYSLRRTRAMVIATGAVLALFQVILILVAKSIQSSNAFGEMEALIPPFARELMGPSMAGMMSFKGMVCLGYFHVAVMGALVAITIAIATVPASEVETGFIDLILSRSVARHWIITRSILAVLLCTAALLMTMMAGTWAGLWLLAPAGAEWPPVSLVTSLAGNLGLLLLCWAGVAMAMGTVSRRRGTATGLAGLFAFAAFLLDYVARVWKSAEPLARLSPFRYYSPFDLLMGTPVPVSNLWVLATAALAGFTLSYLFFSRRDISR